MVEAGNRGMRIAPVAMAIAAAMSLAALLSTPLAQAEPAIPNYWDERERLPKPDLSAVERLRFLTTVDFPPFSFIDASGRLAGFHVDLARAICAELDMTARCQIQALPWEELDQAIEEGQGEALIAGTSVTAESRERYAFSRPYMRFPARFVVRGDSPMNGEPLHRSVAGQKIGVLAGSAHESMLRAYFPAAQIVPEAEMDELYRKLRDGETAGIFGDGMRLAFWLGSAGSQDCCRFAGGPYLAPEFLGAGLSIAARPEDAILVEGFDFALREINVKGVFAELYLKYFPVSFY
jgi:polar amino acid transport system substrate-binding protein